MFFNRYVIDEYYDGLAFEEEGERCAELLANPAHKTMIMGNHGVMTIGDGVGDAFNRLYYFERAARTYIQALQTGQPLRVLSDEIAEKQRARSKPIPLRDDRHLSEILAILDKEEPDFRD